MEQMVVSIDID